MAALHTGEKGRPVVRALRCLAWLQAPHPSTPWVDAEGGAFRKFKFLVIIRMEGTGSGLLLVGRVPRAWGCAPWGWAQAVRSGACGLGAF